MQESVLGDTGADFAASLSDGNSIGRHLGEFRTLLPFSRTCHEGNASLMRFNGTSQFPSVSRFRVTCCTIRPSGTRWLLSVSSVGVR